MRTTLLVSLLDAASLNAARGNPPQGFFESGAVYIPARRADAAAGPSAARQRIGPAAEKAGVDQLPYESDSLAALVPGDFFAAKGHLEALGLALRAELSFDRANAPFVHPGRAAHIYAGGGLVGWLGEIHPRVAAQLGRRPGRGVRARPRPPDRRDAGGGALHRPHELPGAAPGHRGRRRSTSAPRAMSCTPSARPAARCWHEASVFDVYRASRSRRARSRWRSRCSSARPTARCPTRTSSRCGSSIVKAGHRR